MLQFVCGTHYKSKKKKKKKMWDHPLNKKRITHNYLF